jgi:alkanesulfonate monooxygenase SsuD/methylene tetrahydromethanopterin reductase-like flavin-dependent oxidoreductase (luciferase family)
MQGKTLREALSAGYERGLNFIGSPKTIAPQMNEVIEITETRTAASIPTRAHSAGVPAEC